jgi:1,4-alpha-glucan branching enzyme
MSWSNYKADISPFSAQLKSYPHAVLGLHSTDNGGSVIRLYRPGAETIYLEVLGQIAQALKITNDGIFEYISELPLSRLDYRIFHQNGLLAHDPYAFAPTFQELDIHLFSRGVHYELFDRLGARLHSEDGICGVKFSLWAPCAKSVSVVADFNYWDGRLCPMRRIKETGIFELFVPGIGVGEKYKFEIVTSQGDVCIKSDPMAYYSEMRPANASVVADLDSYKWGDDLWIQSRKEKGINIPMTIYEVHLGSWKKKGDKFLDYRQLALELSDYCKTMGFSHIELMPVAEHPLDESWGYQITGPFSVTSRYGKPLDFQYFVDHMHQCGIGVIVDWVSAHFPMDDFSLARFDGSCLYEHEDPRQGIHPHWNTHIFNYGRFEVSNYLIASALFWFDKMHVDGLRVDAVASMLYLDYGRNEGEWISNPYGGKENLEAIEFLKHLNAVVHERFPGVLMIAEESTSFPRVSHKLQDGGLGFDMKWNMGWMNDTLHYFKVDPFFRHHHHNSLTFGLLYAFSERFLLVLSHDEVVHGKASLLSKMPGDVWQKFAGVRLLYSYMICQMGKKLLFMGAELGMWSEWNCKEELPWHLLQQPLHSALSCMIKDLNHFYLREKALWQFDFEPCGFNWVDFSDRKNSVISYLRKADDSLLLCIHNFTPSYFPHYFIRLAHIERIEEVFNTDSEEYGGSGKINTIIMIEKREGLGWGFSLQLSPLATIILRVKFLPGVYYA